MQEPILVTGKQCFIKGYRKDQFWALSFLNGIFYFIHNSELYNYADDNTVSYADTNINKLIKTLEEESKIHVLINWFSINKMKANPENFQAIAVGRKTHDKNLKFNLEGIEIECETEVKLLGVTIDFKLNFNEHISNICKKKSINATKCIENRQASYKTWKTNNLLFIYYVQF